MPYSYDYIVEMKAKAPNRSGDIHTFRQHAYSPVDALKQATLAAHAQGYTEMTPLRVYPPESTHAPETVTPESQLVKAFMDRIKTE